MVFSGCGDKVTFSLMTAGNQVEDDCVEAEGQNHHQFLLHLSPDDAESDEEDSPSLFILMQQLCLIGSIATWFQCSAGSVRIKLVFVHKMFQNEGLHC